MRARSHFHEMFLVGVALALFVPCAQAKSVKVLYDFSNLSDGAYPAAGVIMDKSGYLYGTTLEGGTGGCAGSGCGTVFKIAPGGTKTVLYSFTGGSDGSGPHGLVIDKLGNLYGTTTAGGDLGCFENGGCGTVFEIAANGTETVLHAFTGGVDGYQPLGGLLLDKKGNLYGTNVEAVFKVSPKGKTKVLYAFGQGGGIAPGAVTLVRDKSGNLYGTAQEGGEYHYGTVFKLSPDGTQTVLHAFTGGSDGGGPYAGVILDPAGNLYGTTPYGGDANCDYGEGCGTVFKVAPDGTEATLYTFTVTGGPASPMSGLTIDKAGNLYGTTNGFSPGTIFRLAPDGTEKMLYTFTGGADGGDPMGGLIMDRKGRLYGTAEGGGNGTCDNGFGCGVVFELGQ